MPRILIVGLVAGLLAGLLVGGFHNLFTVPVIERAIDFEEAQGVGLHLPTDSGLPVKPDPGTGTEGTMIEVDNRRVQCPQFRQVQKIIRRHHL